MVQWKIILSVLFILLFSGCTDYCPDDGMAPRFNDTDLAWFAFFEDDTTFYKDATSGDIFYLLCVDNEISTTTEFRQTEDCASGGFNVTFQVMTNSFESDFPHFNNTNLMLKMEVGKGTYQ